MDPFKRVLNLTKEVSGVLKRLSNLIQAKFLQILAISFFKWFYKGTKCYPLSGVKITIFSEKSQKSSSGRSSAPDPVRESHTNFSFDFKPLRWQKSGYAPKFL